jgi:MFS family permease
MLNRRFVSLCLILFLSALVTAPIHLLFPVYIEDALKQTVFFAALLRAVPIGLGGLFALVGGAFSDRLGRKPTLIIGMTGALITGIVFVSKQPLLILAALCYQGVASGFQTAGGQSYLMNAVASNQLGFATAFYFLTYTFGGAVGNAVGGELISRYGYQAVGLGSIGVMVLLIGVALIFLPDLSTNSPGAKRESVAQMLAGYRKMLRRREIRLLLGMRFFPTYYWGAVNLFLPVLIHRASGVKMAAYYGAFSQLFAAGCQLLSGRICDAVGPRIPAFVTTCLITLSAALIALYTESTVVLYAAGIFGAGAAWSLSVAMPRFINEFSTNEEKGRGVGITHFAWSAGFLSGQVVSGRLEVIHISLPFAVAAVFLVISAMLALRLWLDGEAAH